MDFKCRTEYRVQLYSSPSSDLTTTTQRTVMTLVDLSYTLSEADQSIWPGNLPFKKTVISEHSDNCIMASVGLSLCLGCACYCTS